MDPAGRAQKQKPIDQALKRASELIHSSHDCISSTDKLIEASRDLLAKSRKLIAKVEELLSKKFSIAALIYFQLSQFSA